MPPKFFLHFFRWFCHPKLRNHIEGDLVEEYQEALQRSGKWAADRKFIIDVVLLFRPKIIRPIEGFKNTNQYAMYKSYIKICWRNLVKDRGYSIINIGGFALGLSVAMLIGLWVYDELSYNKQHTNYNNIAGVLQNVTIDGTIQTWATQSYQLGPELRNNYGSHFKRVVMSTFPINSILTYKDKTFTIDGCFMEADAPDLLSLQMLHGTGNGLDDPTSILLSASVANSLFGDEDAIGKVIRVDNREDLKVIGVYKDLPRNSSFYNELFFIAPLDVLVKRGGRNFSWGNNWLAVFVQVSENVKFEVASKAIKDVKLKNIDKSELGFKPELFLHPMPKWHLYSGFKNGINSGGEIEFVWLFSVIGVFVLLLASINFINLSTARSQKRAKEVGIRKVIGSGRSQLISQFFGESLFVVSLAFVFAILLVQLCLPWFNSIADKNISLQANDPVLWLCLSGAVLIVSIISGSYPAFFLSGFQPIRALKGTFRTDHHGVTPRKVLVVTQFSVSVALIIGTIIVYQQIQFAKSRPLGYDLNGLVTIPIKTDEVKRNYRSFRSDLLASGHFFEVSTSETTITNLWWSDTGFRWKGKDPSVQDMIYRGSVDYEFGRTIGWKIKQGRDFSRDFPSDSTSMILNEAAVKYMGFKDPIGEIIQGYGRNYTVIGVVEDMVTQSLYQPNKQTIFVLDPFDQAHFINVRISPQSSAIVALEELRKVFLKHNADTPFEYTFADVEFADKFSFEQQFGKLVAIFAVLAIIISSLGLFGLSSFVAEQRTKEIGVRKVLGASVFSIWKMLSKDFIGLVVIAVIIAAPVAYYFMNIWLLQYDYRTEIGWSIFALSGACAVLITLLTVSYQSIKAGLANPVNSLRSE